MQWDVELAEPFSYSTLLFLLAFFILALIIYRFIKIWQKGDKKEEIKEIKEVVEYPNRYKIKMEYLDKIDALLLKVREKKIETRKAYNELSILIREYIFKVTKVDLLKYSLDDFKKLNNHVLLELITEYYEPEFSYHGTGNIEISIVKTRKVIEEWK